MGSARRQEVAATLRRLSVELEIRRNPLVEDLLEYDERVNAERALRDLLPALNAAASLTRGSWCSAQGDLSVQLVEQCSSDAARCVALDPNSAASPDEQRARFLAWPISYAVVLHAASKQSALEVADLLRSRQGQSTHIALALAGEEVHSLPNSSDLDSLATSARLVIEAAKGLSDVPSDLLEGIAKAASKQDAADPLPLLQLPPIAVLVVPRLSSLSSRRAFLEEIRERSSAHGLPVTWRYVGRPD